MSPDRIVGTLAGEVAAPLRTRMMSRDWSAPGEASWAAMSVASWVMLVASVLSVASNCVWADRAPCSASCRACVTRASTRPFAICW